MSGRFDLLFNHPEGEDWYWSEAADAVETALPGDDPHTLDTIEAALDQLPDLMTRYSAWQIATGFEFLFNNALSSYAFLFADARIAEADRVRTAGKIFRLFDLLFRNAATWTGPAHRDRNTAAGPQGYINTVCYMFWDNCPLTDMGIPAIRAACIDVMERCLLIPNNAVIESALHGLGHLAPENARATELTAGFASRGIGHPELTAYARAASAGRVQ